MNESGTTSTFLVSDELWSRIEPLLPVHVNTHRFGGGKRTGSYAVIPGATPGREALLLADDSRILIYQLPE